MGAAVVACSQRGTRTGTGRREREPQHERCDGKNCCWRPPQSHPTNVEAMMGFVTRALFALASLWDLDW